MSKFVLLCFLFFVGQAEAAEVVKVKSPYSGSGEAGYSSNSGNTVNEAFYVALKLKYQKALSEVKAKVDVNYKTEQNIKTQERYVGDVQLNNFFSNKKKAYLFGQVRLVSDVFDETDLESNLIAGVGYLYKRPKKLKFVIELGAGDYNVRYTKVSGRKAYNSGLIKVFSKFEYQLNPQVAFEQDVFKYFITSSGNFESNTGFKVKLSQKVHLKLAYQYRYHNASDIGEKKVDTQTRLTFIYDF